jgi:copper chaperone NosL
VGKPGPLVHLPTSPQHPWLKAGYGGVSMKAHNMLILFVLIVLMSCAPLGAQEAQPAKIGPGDKCPVCGMFVAKYPDFVAQIIFKDGSHAFFDGVKDMMKFYFDLPKYNPKKTGADIAAILVTDYYKMTLIDGLQAFYVIGSDVYGPMGKELMPFKDEAAAKEFKVDHKGTSILSFKDITTEIIKPLD